MLKAIETVQQTTETASPFPFSELSGFRLNQFPRIERLRAQILAAQPAICVERARLVTEYFKLNGFNESRPVMRQAEMLAYVLDRMPVTLFDDELIVGSTTTKRLGMIIYPEFTALTIWPDLPTISRRKENPVAITDKEVELLSNEIFPFWRDLNIHEYVRREWDNPESLQIFERLCFYVCAKSNGISHIIPNHKDLVGKGLLAIIDEAAEHEKKAHTLEQKEFHAAVRVTLSAVIRFAERYAEACETAAQTADAIRAAELTQCALALRNSPANPARNLLEGLQAIWIMQIALHQENTNAAICFGRMDQYLYPLYRADMESGRLDAQSAGELIASFFIKMGDHTFITPRAAFKLLGGASTNQAVTIGGVNMDGSDATNDLSFLCLKMAELLALREPNLSARLHEDSPPEFRLALMESVQKTGALPALYNDITIIKALVESGATMEHARDYGVVGCVETTSAGRTMGMTAAVLFNVPAVLELALNDGIHPMSGTRVGPATGNLSDFKTYDEFYDAFKLQLSSMAALAVEANNQFSEAHAVLHPTPLLSSLIEGSLEKGLDVTRGGATYNASGVAVVGLADVTDSLAALKTLVFDKKLISPETLADALKKDFKGHEKIRAALINKAPKYGNDDPAADDIAVALVNLFSDTFAAHSNPRGGKYNCGYWSLTTHAGNFACVGALPNGRRKDTPLASGATPVSGVSKKGPTASLASTAKLPCRKMVFCMANNHKFSRRMMDAPGKLQTFAKMTESFFRLGGMQLQFNIYNKETLVAAKENPAEYRDLLVRVSGYSAYFCDLNPQMQNEIISRTEDNL